MLQNVIISATIVFLLVMHLKRGEKQVSNINKKEIIAFVGYFLLLFFSMLLVADIFNDSYQMIDDHETYAILRGIKNNGLIRTIMNNVVSDMVYTHRYRFTYRIIRPIQCAIFKDNFNLWHAMYGLLTAINTSIAYLYARYRKTPILQSFLFALLIFIGGAQINVVWRLGPQENIGIFVLLLAVFSLRLYYDNGHKSWIWISVFFTLWVAGAKETFLLLIPSLIILPLYWIICDKEDISVKDVLVDYVKRFYIYIAFSLIIFFASILLIVNVVGVGYGVNTKFTIIDYLFGFGRILKTKHGILPYIIMVTITAVYTFINVLKDKRIKKIYMWIVATSLLAGNTLLQFVLHAKGGMVERYLIPSTVVMMSYTFIFGCNFLEKDTKRIKGFIVVTALVAILMCNIVNDIDEGRVYSQDGKNSAQCIQKVAEEYDGGDILVDLGEERGYAMCVYLKEIYDISNVYSVTWNNSKEGAYIAPYLPSDTDKKSIDYKDADIVVMYASTISEEKKQRLMTDYSMDDSCAKYYVFKHK